MTATEQQIRDLATAIVQQAEALAKGRIPEGQRHAHIRRLLGNAECLAEWAPDDRRFVGNQRSDVRVTTGME